LNQKSKNAESLEEEDCQLLKSLISKISEEDHQSKRLYYNPGFNPSSSNAQAIASNLAVSAELLDASCPAGAANLSVNFFYFSFWDSFLANLSSFKVVDPLALSNLSFRDRTL